MTAGAIVRQTWRDVVRRAVAPAPAVALVAPPAAPPVPEPESLALVRVVVEQRRRLMVDAEQIHEQVRAAHDAASQALEAAKARLDAAMAASAAAREDEDLAIAAARAAVRVQHETRDLEQAKASLDDAAGRLERERRSVEEADRALGRETALHALRSDPVEDFLANVAHDLVQAVVTIRTRLAEARDRMAAHNAFVAEYDRLRTAGDPRIAPLEGFMLAAHVARYLQDAGATFPRTNVFEIEWIFSPPKSPSDPVAKIHEALRRSVGFVIDALDWGDRNRLNGVPERGRDLLGDVAQVFAGVRDRGEAVQALDALHRSRGQVFDAEARAGHEERLTKAASAEQRELRNRGRGRDARGRVIGPPEPEGEPTDPARTEGADDPRWSDATVG